MNASSKAANYLLATALLITIVIIAVWSEQLGPGYAFKPDMAVAAATTVTALLAVSLFVERAMAVFNAILFGEDYREAEDKLLGANPKLGAKEMKQVLGKRERVRLFGSFLAGAFISAAGVRTLDGLLTVPAQNPPTNSFFLPVDIVLTAGLIAGGSNGLAFLLQVIKDVLAPADQAQAPTAGAPGSQAPPTRAKSTQVTATTPAAGKFYRARLTTA